MKLLPRAVSLCALFLALSAGAALAQWEDARPVPRGMVGIRVAGWYVRYDERFGEEGGPLGAPFATPLPAALFPPLDTVRTGLAAFFEATRGAGEPFALAPEDLTPGTLEVGMAADLRRIPISLEAGVLSRLALRVTVPVERRGTQLTGLGLADAALGPNLAADSLARLFGRVSPGLEEVGRLPLLPVAGSRAGRALQERFREATGDTTPLPLPTRALSRAELNQLLGAASLDPVPFTSQRGDYLLGDVEVEARFQLLDTFGGAQAGGRGARVALEGGIRLPTAQGVGVDSLTGLVSESGHPGATAALFGDAFLSRRLWITGAARYARLLPRDVERLTLVPGTPFPTPGPVRTVERDPGDRLELALTPRYRLTDEISLGGHYAYVRIGETVYGGAEDATVFAGIETTAARSVQRFGVGASYSTLDAFLAGRTPVPLEFSIHYENAFAGTARAEDVSAVRIMGRVFYPLWGQ